MGADGYVSRKQNGTTGYLFKDAHGDVLSAYSSTTNKIADYIYDAWGEQRSVGNYTWGKENPIRYNGQFYDTESGMTYLRARYYDSNLRCFITEDPIRDGVNWYSYAGNNPVMMCDPSGLADVPNGGVKIYNNLINNLLEIINSKANYINESSKGNSANKELLNEYHNRASAARYNIKINLELLDSEQLKNVIQSVVIEEQDGGGIQSISSVIAIACSLREAVIKENKHKGEEIYPEDKIKSAYNYYRASQKVYITSATDNVIDTYSIISNILSRKMWSAKPYSMKYYSGYTANGIYYDIEVLGGGDSTFFEQEDCDLYYL